MSTANKTAAYKQLENPSARAIQETNLYADAALARAVDGTNRTQLQLLGFPDPCTVDSDLAYLGRVVT